MYKKDIQMAFEDFVFPFGDLDPENEWVKLSDLIPWDKEDIETPVVKAPREKNIIPGSFATPEAIAHIMTQKFVVGSPLCRQEQENNRKGIHLSRQTMSN